MKGIALGVTDASLIGRIAMTTELFTAPAATAEPTATTPQLAGPSTKLIALTSALQGRTYTDSKGIVKTVGPETTFMGIWSLAAQTLKVERKSLSGYKAYEMYNSIVLGRPVLETTALAARNQQNAVIKAQDAHRIEQTKVAQLGLFDAGIGALIVKQTDSQIDAKFEAKGLDRFTKAHMDELDKLVKMGQMKVIN